MTKKKIAVIGGGLGAMTAIYHLMNRPNARELYDISVYQLGWRLGGKGASGANPEMGYRIEEHGIHFWFGFYENGFRLMRDVYERLGRPPGTPLATFDEAFKSQPYMVFTENVDGRWVDWRVDFPNLPGRAGDGVFIDPVRDIFEAAMNYLADEVARHFQQSGKGCLGFFLRFFSKRQRANLENSLESEIRRLESALEARAIHPLEKRLRATAALLSNPEFHDPKHLDAHLNHFRHLRKWLWDLVGNLIYKNDNLRRLWEAADFALAFLSGMLKDGVVRVENGRFVVDFSVINDCNFVEWLVKHGADARRIGDFPPVKSMYDGPFAFFRGNVRSPNVEAGTALNIFLRLAVTSKEHVMWRMQAGMGDVIFTPIYQLLKKEYPENVHWHFFHKAQNIRLAEDGKTVAAVEFDRQVNLKPGVSEYDPLLLIDGLSSWPTRPLWEQLDPVQARALQARNINLESAWSGWTGEPHRIELGRDFDEVVIGASLASLNDFCPELIEANPAWAVMLDKVGTVQTQAFQLWMTADAQQLGVDLQKVLSTYVEPLDTFAEMNQALRWERWGDLPEKPRYLAYVCGALEDAADISPYSVASFPHTQTEKVFQNMRDFIEKDLRHILPGAFDENGAFKWDILFDPENRTGPDRLRAQYCRANLDTSERYVFSLAGSSKYRLKTDQSGFSNLFLTGDWIQNGFNIGFVEGAVTSGILTARAVSGSDDIAPAVPW